MPDAFLIVRAFDAYRASLSAFEAHVGCAFDRAAYLESGEVAYGLGLRPEHNDAYRASVVQKGEAEIVRLEAREKAAAASSAAVARTATNAEVADAIRARADALRGISYGSLTAHDVDLINEVARRLRGAR